MIWALDAQVAARASVVVRPHDADEVQAVLRVVQRGARSGHRGRGPQRRVRRERAGVRRRAARPHRDRGHRRRRHRRRCSSTCGPARSATCSRTRCAPSTASRAGTGRSRWRCRPSAAGSRAAARVSSRPATARSRTSSRASTSCSPTARSSTPAAAPRAAVGPDLTQLFVGSEGHARHHRRRPAACPPAARGRDARARTRSRRSPTGSTRCARSCSAARRPRCCACTTRSRATATTRPATRHVLLVFDEADAHLVEATRRIVDEECSRAGADALDVALVGRWFEHRNDVSALEALISRGLRRRHDGDCRRRGARCPRCTRARPRRSAASSTRWPRRRTRATRIPTARACTSRSRAGRPRTGARRTTGPRGTPVSGRCSRRVARSRTTTASGSTVPASCRRARRGLRRAAIGEGRARPERHPQPRQARPAQPVRRRCRGRRPRPRRRRRHEQRARGRLRRRRQRVARRRAGTAPRLARRRPRRVRRDARWPTCASQLATRRDRTGRSGRRRRHLRTSAARPSCGTARPAKPVGPGLGWQDLRTVGECLALRADGLRVGPNQSATKLQWLLDQLGPIGRAPATSASAPSTRGSRGRCRKARSHVTDATNAAVTGLQVLADPSAWDARIARASSTFPPRCCRRSSTRAAIVGEARALPGAPPIAALVGDQQASLVGQGCVRPGDAKITFGTGGMLDLVLGDAPPSVRHARQGGHVPDRRVARTTATSRGASRRSCSRPAPTCSGCATTSASSRAPTSRTSSRRSCADTRRRRVRARAARTRHAGVGLRRARRAVRPDARHRAGPRSCARCSKASRSAAPISSTRPRPTPASRSRSCASTAA